MLNNQIQKDIQYQDLLLKQEFTGRGDRVTKVVQLTPQCHFTAYSNTLRSSLEEFSKNPPKQCMTCTFLGTTHVLQSTTI